MTFGNRVISTTQDELLPSVMDTVLNSNVFTTRQIGSPVKFGGKSKQYPIKYATNTTFGSFAGFDTFSTAATDNRQLLQFNPSFAQITVTLPFDELSVNMTDKGIIDMMKVQMASDAQDMADGLGTMFWGAGTGNSNKDFLGLAAIVDDGTTVATIGGLSRSTYPTLDSTVTASSGVISIAKMETLYNAIGSGMQVPTAGYTDKPTYALYNQLLIPQERIAKELSVIKGGVTNGTSAKFFPGLYFAGFPIVPDEKATTGVLAFLNEKYIDWAMLPMVPGILTERIKFVTPVIKGNDYKEMMGLGFSWSGWIKPSNQAAIIGHIYIGGQLCSPNPKRHGKLTGITST